MLSSEETLRQIETLLLSTDEEKRAQFPRSPDPGKDDEWVPSMCNMCGSACPIRVHRVDGVLVKIEGNATAHTRGKICPKGNAGIMRMYDPNRIKTPLKRTNPEKGIGVDPEWVEISWDEAVDIITNKLKEVRESDPRNLLMGSMDFQRVFLLTLWARAYGCPVAPSNGGTAGGMHCGNGQHSYGAAIHSAFVEWAEPELTKMLLLIGAGTGHEAYHQLSADARRIAEARLRGMRLVVVDPRMSAGAAKADEWVPIRPGTDSALVLGMVNVLLNELGIYDSKFLKIQTNGPYLIGPDGYYVRDKDSGKPLVWDAVDAKTKIYDDPSIRDYAIEGAYQVQGVECKPSFQMLREHVRKYSPERVQEITSVPKETVRRLAREWGEAASIGSTVTIEGKEFPYRPVSVLFYRGNQAHKHALLDTMALYMLSMVVGAFDVPGGQLRWDILGASSPSFPSNRMFVPPIPQGEDGLVQSMVNLIHVPQPVGPTPQLADMSEYFPLAFATSHACYLTVAEPERYGFKKGQHVFLFHHTNPMMSMGDPKLVEKALQNSYVINCNIVLDETAELSDLVIPEPTYLERYNFNSARCMCYLGFQVSVPAVKEPLYGCRDFLEVLIEVWDRLGILRGEQGLNWWFNLHCQLQEPHALDLNRKYTWPEMIDRCLQSHNGSSEYNLDWFRQNGHRIRLATAAEKYQPYGHARLQLYSETMKRTGDNLRREMEAHKVEQRIGVKWDFSDYQPLPDWKPGPIHTAPPEYDLFAVNYKTVLFTFSAGAFNPYLMELAEKDPYVLKLWINTAAAKERGLKEGDTVWVESPVHRLQGILTISESIHPECVGIASTLGHWARHSIARGKGMHFGSLNPVNLDWTDFVSMALEGVTSRVKVYKATGRSGNASGSERGGRRQ